MSITVTTTCSSTMMLSFFILDMTSMANPHRNQRSGLRPFLQSSEQPATKGDRLSDVASRSLPTEANPHGHYPTDTRRSLKQMADACHRTVSAMVFPDLDSLRCRGVCLDIGTRNFPKHLCPELTRATKVDWHDLEGASLGLQLAKAQPAVEHLQCLEEVNAASRRNVCQGRCFSG
jgi:hypothetical protein